MEVVPPREIRILKLKENQPGSTKTVFLASWQLAQRQVFLKILKVPPRRRPDHLARVAGAPALDDPPKCSWPLLSGAWSGARPRSERRQDSPLAMPPGRPPARRPTGPAPTGSEGPMDEGYPHCSALTGRPRLKAHRTD